MVLPCEIPVTGSALKLAQAISSHVPVITTERLRLRAPRTEDFALFNEIVRGPRGEHFGEMTRESAWLDFAQMAAGWVLRGHGAWTVEPLRGGDPLGFVLLGLDPEDPETELGYLLSEAAEGQGYGFEAARAALGFAFEALGWCTLVSYIAPENTRSIALAERLGARRDGELTEPDGSVSILVYRHDRRPA